MGSIFTRTLADGTLRYRAVIRVHRKDYPIFRESKTFNSRRKADSRLKKREVAIKANPNILYGNQHEGFLLFAYGLFNHLRCLNWNLYLLGD